MILAFVWAGLAALGLLCGVLWYSGGNVFGVNQELLYSLTVTGGLTEMIGVPTILSALVCELLTLPQDAVRDWGNLNSLTMGIVLILASLIFRYGAELETQKQEESSCYE